MGSADQRTRAAARIAMAAKTDSPQRRRERRDNAEQQALSHRRPPRPEGKPEGVEGAEKTRLRGALPRAVLTEGGVVIVDRLPFIVVLGTGKSGLLRQRLGGFVGFETAEELLFALGVGGLPQASITEHQIIVGLEIFRVDSQCLLDRADGVGAAPLH